MAKYQAKPRRVSDPTLIKADTVRTVREKEVHYQELLAEADKVSKYSDKAHYEVGRVSYGSGYLQAVADCRQAVKAKKI